MRLYLVRHAQTAWNAEHRAQGHTDIPLDSIGRAQAMMLGHRFAAKRIDRILSSDLQRAHETAKPIAEATGAEIELVENLRERSFGDWEGDPFQQISDRWPELEAIQGKDRLELRPPNGESFVDVWQRLDPIAQRLENEMGNIVVVTHGGVCGLLLAKLIQGTVGTSRAFRFGNTSITKLERRPEGLFMIQYYNETSHLQEEVMAGSVDGTLR